MANARTTPEWAKTPNFGVIVALRHFGAASTSKLFAREWMRQNHTTQPEKPVNVIAIWGHFSLGTPNTHPRVKNQPGVYVSNNQ
eukprot:scaffold8087_cov141-Skeletonema_marinoi.AAC.10